MKHLTKVEIENVRGIRHQVIELGAITIIRGQNGWGKSSILDAIRYGFEGGYDPLSVSTWADTAKIVLTGDDGSTITRIIDKQKRQSRVEIRSAAGEVIAAPQTWLKELSSAFSYDPLRLLRCSPKERFAYLKETLAVEVNIDEMLRIARENFIDEDVIYGAWDAKAAGLDRIAKLRKAAYDRRTAINRKARDLEGSIVTMKASVPSLNADGTEWREAEANLAQKLSAAKSARATAVQQANDEASAAKDAIDAWEREEIAKIHAESARRRETIVTAHSAAIAQIQDEHDPVIADLSQQHATARQQLSDYDKAIGAREAIARLEDELKGSRTLGEKLTLLIEGIDKLEKEKLAASPVPGVELRDGEIWIDGVAFDGVNTQRRYEVAIQIGAINAGPLRFMLCDEMEHWDKEHFDVFTEAAREAGFQVVAAIVDDVPLKVETR